MAEACSRFQRSQDLDPGLGTELNLASCWQQLGRNASAWALFREVESQAHAVGQSMRERVAHDRAAALEPLLSKLLIEAEDEANLPDVKISRDGVDVPRELWGTPVPVDPATHVVDVRVPSKEPWAATVDVQANGRVVTVSLPAVRALADVHVPRPPPVAPPASVAPSAVAPPAPGAASMMPASSEVRVVENRGGAQRAIGWLLVGAGFVGLGAATYFGVWWLNTPSSNPDLLTRRNNAEIAVGAGAGALLLGAVLGATAPHPRVITKTVAGVELTPMVGPTRTGIAVRYAW